MLLDALEALHREVWIGGVGLSFVLLAPLVALSKLDSEPVGASEPADDAEDGGRDFEAGHAVCEGVFKDGTTE